MTRIEIARTIVHHMIDYGIGVAGTAFFREHRSHSDNKAIELALDVSTFLTVVAVSGTVREPVHAHTDAQIDQLIVWWNKNVTNRPKY